MKRKKKIKNRVSKILVASLALIILFLLFCQIQAESAVESFLEKKIPAHIALEYDDLDVNLLASKIQFSEVFLKIRDRDTTLNHTFIDVDEVTVNGLSYWQFFLRNTIKASEVLVGRPKVTYYPSKTFRNNSKESKGVVNLLKDIAIDRIAIFDGSFEMGHKQNDSTQISAQTVNFSLTNGKTNPEIIQQKIPITYTTYDFSAQDIFVNLGAFETATADALVISEKDAKLSKLVLESKYNKASLSKILQRERDHISLKIPECSLKNTDFGFEENRFFFASQFGEIENLNLNIYRDKLIADDDTPKRMYNAVLRELPFDLNIDSLALVKSKIRYEEKVKSDAKAGNLFFDNVNLKFKNISNTYSEGNQTVANLDAKLMGVVPITLAYNFDMNDKNDAFTLATTLHGLNGAHVNAFLRPNLNSQIKGRVDELYFTTTGNRNSAKGDMKMKYKDLKFQILKKDRLKINKVLSAIGSLFINDGSDADAQGYRYGSIDVERDSTKSFFNYVWASTQDGLLSTLTGNGRKENQ